MFIMENPDYISLTGGSLGLLSFILFIIDKLKHSKLRSKCCGRKMEISMDLNSNSSSSNDLLDGEVEYIFLEN